jgi:O-antigen ligase
MLAAQAYSIVICMCRAPWLSLLAALFVIQLFDRRFRRLFVLIAIAAAILLGLTWDQVSGSTAVARINDENSTLEGRQARWQAGLNMWLAQPVRGWGFNRYERESWRFRTDDLGIDLEAPENDYLTVMIGSGLLGFLPYMGVLLIPLWRSLRLIFQARRLERRGQTWPGFVKPETLAVLCAVIVSYLIYSFSAANVIGGTKLILLTLAGTVAGTHEHLLRRRAGSKRRQGATVTPSNPIGDANPGMATQRLNI